LIVVSDTGPLIALAKVNLLEVLRQLYERIAIPSAVYDELLAKDGPEIERLNIAFDAGYLYVIVPRWLPDISPEIERLTDKLGAGERQAIGLVFQLRGWSESEPPGLLLIDDRAARTVASALGIPLTGVVGVLVRAKQDGYIEKIRPLLESIYAEGYWLSEALIERTSRLMGE
jgi:uncharacterized protein